MSIHTIYLLNYLILCFFIIMCFGYTVLLFLSIFDIRNNFIEVTIGDISRLTENKFSIPISIIIPAYNEEANILETIHSVLRNTYKNVKIVVVNDGSKDRTLEKLVTTFGMRKIMPLLKDAIKTSEIRSYYISNTFPNITVIDKVNAGTTADALNVGLNAITTPLFLTLDADSLLEPDAIMRLIYSMLSRPHTIVAGGAVYILNGCEYRDGVIIKPRLSKALVPALQTCEYLRSFLFARSGWNMLGGWASYSGTLTLFELQPVLEAGGFDPLQNPAQDAEVIIHLHEIMRQKHRTYNITFCPTSFAWTDVPNSLGEFWNQRSKWQIGMLRSTLKHFNMFLNPRYGIIGLLVYPYFLIVEVFGPIVEFTAYALIFFSWYLHILDYFSAVLLILINWGFLTFLTMTTVCMYFATFDKYRRIGFLFKMFFLVVIEMFGFRQFLIVCRVNATIKYFFAWLFKKRGKNNAMEK